MELLDSQVELLNRRMRDRSVPPLEVLQYAEKSREYATAKKADYSGIENELGHSKRNSEKQASKTLASWRASARLIETTTHRSGAYCLALVIWEWISRENQSYPLIK